MKGTFGKYVLVLLVGFLPTVVLAANLFDVAATDKSMQYLGMIFGGMGSLPIQSQTQGAEFSKLVYIFNQIIFTLGIIIVSYTAFAGVIATAQEGEVMGKKWSSIIIPVRAGIGVYLLIPSGATSYNWIQIIVMWFIIQGVGAANALWKQVIVSSQTEGSIHKGLGTSTLEVSMQNSMATIDSIFRNSVCMEKLNQLMDDPNPVYASTLGEPITVFRFGDKVYFGRYSKRTIEEPLCGSVGLPSVGQSALTRGDDPQTEIRKNMLANTVTQIQGILAPSAQEAVAFDSTQWSFYTNFVTADGAIHSLIQQLASTFQNMDDVYQQAIINGWIHAGSYYFNIVSATANKTLNMPAVGMNTIGLTTLFGQTLSGNITSSINSAASNYETYVLDNIKSLAVKPPTSNQMAFHPVSGEKAEIQAVMDAMFGSFFIDLAANIGNTITTEKGDPIISMATFGGNLAVTVEIIFWTSLVAVFFIWMVSSIMSCMQPLGHALDYVLVILIPIVVMIISLLWVAGITLALYVPLIPYIVFTFGAIAWIILVIEAMLGAPLIALTLIVPSEDEIGKAGHAIIILLGLFLRPALMILGFIFAIKFLIVAIGMLNFAFGTTLKQSISMGFGMFGFIAVLILYVGIATALVHEAFSLIYLLPDKVLRWMGGAPEDTGKIAQKAKEMEGAVQKGAGMGKGMMKGAMSQFSKKK